jgi:predicted RND superfamily exporter protein
MFTTCVSTCGQSSPVSDTVQVSMPPPEAPDEKTDQPDAQVVDDADAVTAEAEAEAEAKQQRVAAAWLRLAEEWEKTTVKSAVDGHLHRKKEVAKAAEAERSQLEALRQEQVKVEAAAALAAEALARREKVTSFLKERGFKDISTGKRSFLKTTYALHDAAKLNNLEMVQVLLEEGADPAKKNSRGQTAAQRAAQKDKKGSHAEVIRVLEERCGNTRVAVAGGA